MPKKKSVQICPVCGSENFTVYKGNKFLDAMGSDENYVCRRCKNVFSIPIEVFDGDVEHIRQEIKKAELSETVIKDTPPKMVVNYGIFIVAILALGLVVPGIWISPLAGLLLFVFGIAGLVAFLYRKIKG